MFEFLKRFFEFSIEFNDGFDRINSCERKVRYGRRESASRAVFKMAKKGIGGLEVYGCRYCEGWHVGH